MMRRLGNRPFGNYNVPDAKWVRYIRESFSIKAFVKCARHRVPEYTSKRVGTGKPLGIYVQYVSRVIGIHKIVLRSTILLVRIINPS